LKTIVPSPCRVFSSIKNTFLIIFEIINLQCQRNEIKKAKVEGQKENKGLTYECLNIV